MVFSEKNPVILYNWEEAKEAIRDILTIIKLIIKGGCTK